MKRVFICSPYRPYNPKDEEDADRQVKENIEDATIAALYATKQGYIPFAPHLYFTRFLLDDVEAERQQGMEMGKEWLALCDEIWVFGNVISKGMREEIQLAKKLNKPISYFCIENGDRDAEMARKSEELHNFLAEKQGKLDSELSVI